jgi:hypothetical protein
MTGRPKIKEKRNTGESLEVRTEAFCRMVVAGTPEEVVRKVLMLTPSEYVGWLADNRVRIEMLGGRREFPPQFYELRQQMLDVMTYGDPDKTMEAAKLLVELMKRAASLGPEVVSAVMDGQAGSYYEELKRRVERELGVVNLIELKDRARNVRLGQKAAEAAAETPAEVGAVVDDLFGMEL